jgi:hypothetical protein
MEEQYEFSPFGVLIISVGLHFFLSLFTTEERHHLLPLQCLKLSVFFLLKNNYELFQNKGLAFIFFQLLRKKLVFNIFLHQKISTQGYLMNQRVSLLVIRASSLRKYESFYDCMKINKAWFGSLNLHMQPSLLKD